MALEQFRTQVLLLHSQQRTLDALGAGFNDRYSVHFATSGSEALSTLGETPIHVIISAQDLPGMSGLEALREAKKRSPDTIGILLAGSDANDGLEALVGDKEVFQIVRGSVEPQALQKIVEDATKRVRMLTLSKSANDTAAAVDIPAFAADDDEGEHIVMETAENGATIISDGTGRLPVLRPEKIQVSPEAGGRNVDVLALTKDSEFLDTIRESSRGLHNVHHATTGPDAQEIAKKHPIGVIVTDAAIAGDKVELLVSKLRAVQPRLVAIVAGRRDDGEMLMELINRGQVYRFLLKPVSPGRARLAVEASVKHHLEGADTAFKGAPPPSSVATVSKPQPAPKPVAAAAPAPVKPKPAPAPVVKKDPPLEAPVAKPEERPVADAPDVLDDDDAFAVDSLTDTGSLKATVAEMTATIGRAKASGDGANTAKNRLPLIAAAAAVLVLGAAGAWMFMSGDDSAPLPATSADAVTDDTAAPAAPAAVDPAPAEQVPAQATATVAEPAAAPTPEYVALLDNARFARDSGRLLAPAGDNAIEWYVAAREAAPGNAVVAQELDALVQQVIGMAETALLENRTDDAASALAMVSRASPGNSRLAFLNAQLEQLQVRGLLDDARVAIRDSRFQDAAALLAQAESIAGSSTAAIGQVADDLAEARSAQRVDDVLAQANQRLTEGSLVQPANDNARYFFELALSNDPRNQAAQQGLLVVASKLVLKARDAIDAEDLEAAGNYLVAARELDPQSAELQAADTALAEASERAAAARAEQERLAEAERLAAEQQAAAERAAEERRRAAASATLSTSSNADADDEVMAANDTPVAAPTRAVSKPAGTAVPAEQRPPKPIAISQLRRVNYVAPEYPRGAQRRNMSGWVDIGFTVTASGETADLEVIESTPGTVFNDAAADAVEQWRFEPFVENGETIPVRVAVRMSFSLE